MQAFIRLHAADDACRVRDHQDLPAHSQEVLLLHPDAIAATVMNTALGGGFTRDVIYENP